MKKTFLILGAVVLGLAALAGIAYGANEAFSQTKTDTRTISQPVRAIVLDVDAADVELVRGADRVQVRETSHYVTSKPGVHRSVENGVLTIKSSCDGPWLLDCSTDFRVHVPADVAVRVESHTGDVTGNALESSDVRVQSDVGDVRLDLARGPDRLEASTDVGEIEIAVPEGVYAVDTATHVGESDVHGLVQDDRAPRTINVQTDVGDVEVRGR
jgi:hypothetical protein